MAWAIGESRASQPGQPPPGALELGQAGGGVFPEVEEPMAARDPEKEGKGPHRDNEDEEGAESDGDA